MDDGAERSRLGLIELQQLWLALSTEQRTALVACARELTGLGPKACRILSRQAERLKMGAIYGDFEKGRAWNKNTIEEHLDGLNYMTAALLEVEETE